MPVGEKNVRSLLDAATVFEQEARLLLGKLGYDEKGVRGMVNSGSMAVAGGLRSAAGRWGLPAGATAVRLVVDIGTLVDDLARLRRLQTEDGGDHTELAEAMADLDDCTKALSAASGRWQARLDGLRRFGTDDRSREESVLAPAQGLGRLQHGEQPVPRRPSRAVTHRYNARGSQL